MLYQRSIGGSSTKPPRRGRRNRRQWRHSACSASTVDTSSCERPQFQVTISSLSGTVATTVRSIYFEFGAAENDYVGCNEIDVNGSATPVPPAAPSNLAATANSASQITLNWTDNSADETGFKVERSPDGSTAWTQIATPAANVTSYADTGRSAVTTYFYRVRATSAAGDSAYTSTVSATTSKLDQTITFGAIAGKTFGDAPFALDATASSGLAVSYESSDTGVATISGNTVTLVAPGSVTITASQSGNASYAPAANVSQGLVIAAPTAAAPVISPAGGSFTSAQSVTISTATSGASIRYTTDGSTPSSTLGTVYTGAVTLSSTTTLKAITYKSGMTDSSVTTAVFTITTAPVINITPDPLAHSMFPGTTATVPLTVSNTGTGALTWSVSNVAVGTYVKTDSTTGGPAYAWLDAVTGGTSLGAATTTYAAVTLPFAMPYFGSSYTSLSISPKGWVSLGADQVGTTYASNQALPSVLAPPNLIAALWDNISITGGSAGVFYKQTDASTFVITYRDVQAGSRRRQRATFQIILKADGRIVFQYQSCTFTDNSYGIGIQNSDASQAVAIANNSAYLSDVTRAITLSPPAAAAWVTGVTPASHTAAGGSLAPGASQVVSVEVDSTGLTPGQIYQTNLVFTSNDASAPTRSVPFALTIVVPPTDLVTFRTANGLAADGSQDLLTPAGDGVANLLKYAFNMIGSGAGQGTTLATPNSSVLLPNGSAGLPFAAVDGSGKLALTYIRRKASASPAPGVSYAVEFSDALATWGVNGSAIESAVSIDATFERVTVTDSANPASRFARVRVTAP